MKSLSSEDLEINRTGTLTKDQLRHIRNKGVVNAIAGLCFLVLLPALILSANIRVGTLLYVVGGAGILFALVFFWSAWGYLSLKKEGHDIKNISGKAEMKSSGNKNIILKIQDRSFFVRKGDVASMSEGEEYTLYYIEDPRVALGWTKVNAN